MFRLLRNFPKPIFMSTCTIFPLLYKSVTDSISLPLPFRSLLLMRSQECRSGTASQCNSREADIPQIFRCKAFFRRRSVSPPFPPLLTKLSLSLKYLAKGVAALRGLFSQPGAVGVWRWWFRLLLGRNDCQAENFLCWVKPLKGRERVQAGSQKWLGGA